MAKVSLIAKEKQKEASVSKFKVKRDILRKSLKDPAIGFTEKLKIQFGLQKLPIRSCPVRLVQRCAITGRSRAVSRRFGITRQYLREEALQGHIPGLKKKSW